MPRRKKIDVSNLTKMSEKDKCFDPMGSYTGRPDKDFGERPVQDADDL